MTHAISIRHAVNDDALPIQDIVSQCFAQYQQQGVVFCLQELPDLITPASSLTQNPPHEHNFLWVAVQQHRIVATIGTHILHKTCEIKRLYVHPKLQGQKIGTQLLSFVCQKFSQHTLCLWSDTRFTKAHQLYDQFGFKSDGTPTRSIDDLSHSKEIYLVLNPHFSS